MSSETTAQALLAIAAMDDGDHASAQVHIAAAQWRARTLTRRDRQVVEIAALAVAGHRARAIGLALEHAAEFATDAAILERLRRGSGSEVERAPVDRVGAADRLGLEAHE